MASLDDALQHLRAGRSQEAYDAARACARAMGADGGVLAVWGVAAVQLGRYDEAVEPLKAAAARARDRSTYAGVMIPLAKALAALGLWAEAARACLAAERAGVEAAELRDQLGAVLFHIGLIERAFPHLEAAAAAHPERPDFQRNLAMALVALGRLDEAEAALERSIADDPRSGVAHMTLANLKRWTPQIAHVERLRALWTDPELPDIERAGIGFGLFKELDDIGATDEAWPVLRSANELARLTQRPWSATDEAAWVDAMIDAFPRERFRREPERPGKGPRPIFIVGLPRSGTTLVERILTAHTAVAAMGELPSWPVLFKQASGSTTPQLLDASVVRGAANADWTALAAAYRRETAYLSQGADYVIDKQPKNAAYIGPIRLAFPDALIVHLSRNPMDGLMGCYKVYFNGAYEWSYRLRDLAAHYLLHQRLLDHWRACLGSDLIEVDYDALACEPERHIRALLTACGLEFQPACLAPECAPGPVATASFSQVRSPISSKGVGAWERYGRQLEPLSSMLRTTGAV